MILSIKCPNCNEQLNIEIINEEVTSVEINGTIHLSDDEIKTILQSMHIEFGVLEGGENKRYE